MMRACLVFVLALTACSKDASAPAQNSEPTAPVAAAQDTPAVQEAKPAPTPPSSPTMDIAQAKPLLAQVEVNTAGEEWEEEIMRKLDPNTLTHKAYNHAVGPFANATVVFDQPMGATVTVTGWVLAEQDGKKTAWRFANNVGAFEEITGVEFVDLKGDGHMDFLVEFTFLSGMGPEGMIPQPGVAAFMWENPIKKMTWADEIFKGVPTTLAEAKEDLKKSGVLK